MTIANGFFRIQHIVGRWLWLNLAGSVRLKSFLYRILWLMPERFREPSPLRDALKKMSGLGHAVTFVNIGANDGMSGDHLREFIITRHWKGVLVEPVPFVFERLVRAYKGVANVQCENSAIAEQDGVAKFWYVRPNDELQPGYDQVGSFNRDLVFKHEHDMFPGIAKFVTSMDVPTLTVRSLLKKHDLSKVDLFLIDAESYDAKIVGMVLDCMASCLPSLIIYEHWHVPIPERESCNARLLQLGYALSTEGENTIAVFKH